MNEIIYGERVSSREFVVDAAHVKEIRKKPHSSYMCYLIDVKSGTLRNWMQDYH